MYTAHFIDFIFALFFFFFYNPNNTTSHSIFRWKHHSAAHHIYSWLTLCQTFEHRRHLVLLVPFIYETEANLCGHKGYYEKQNHVQMCFHHRNICRHAHKHARTTWKSQQNVMRNPSWHLCASSSSSLPIHPSNKRSNVYHESSSDHIQGQQQLLFCWREKSTTVHH